MGTRGSESALLSLSPGEECTGPLRCAERETSRGLGLERKAILASGIAADSMAGRKRESFRVCAGSCFVYWQRYADANPRTKHFRLGPRLKLKLPWASLPFP